MRSFCFGLGFEKNGQDKFSFFPRVFFLSVFGFRSFPSSFSPHLEPLPLEHHPGSDRRLPVLEQPLERRELVVRGRRREGREEDRCARRRGRSFLPRNNPTRSFCEQRPGRRLHQVTLARVGESCRRETRAQVDGSKDRVLDRSPAKGENGFDGQARRKRDRGDRFCSLHSFVVEKALLSSCLLAMPTMGAMPPRLSFRRNGFAFTLLLAVTVVTLCCAGRLCSATLQDPATTTESAAPKHLFTFSPPSSALSTSTSSSSPFAPSGKDYPNPTSDPAACNRPAGRPSWLCDPDALLPRGSADEIEGILRDIAQAKKPFAASACAGQHSGYQVALAALGRLDLSSSGSSSASDAAEEFAAGIMDLWGVGHAGCDDGVVIVLSREDRQVGFLFFSFAFSFSTPTPRGKKLNFFSPTPTTTHTIKTKTNTVVHPRGPRLPLEASSKGLLRNPRSRETSFEGRRLCGSAQANRRRRRPHARRRASAEHQIFLF